MIEHYYFAYGSNMNPSRMAARGMRMRDSRAATLHGWQLAFNKRAHGRDGVAYANIIESPSGSVPGVLYGLCGEADILRMDPNEGWPERYRREVLTVQLAEGGTRESWVYIANPRWQASGLLPERWYLNHLLSGRPWLPDAYYRWLSQTPCHPL